MLNAENIKEYAPTIKICAILLVAIILLSTLVWWIGLDHAMVHCIMCGKDAEAWRMKEIPGFEEYHICKKCYNFASGKG